MPEERDYSQTGPGSTTQYRYLNLDTVEDANKMKFYKLRLGKDSGTQYFPSWVGYVVNALPPVWKEANGDIPARYEYGIVIESKSPEGDGLVQQFCFTLSSHWRSPIVSDIVNQLAGAKADPNWNGLMCLSVYTKRVAGNNRPISRACLFQGSGQGSPKLPTKFPWVGTKEDGHFEGVPQSKRDTAGNADFSEVSDFWHNEWLLLCKLFGHDLTPATTTNHGVTGSADHVTGKTTPAAAAPPQTDKVNLPLQGYTWIVNKYTGVTKPVEKFAHLGGKDLFLALTKECFDLMEKRSPSNADRDKLGQMVYAYGLEKRIFDGLLSQKIDHTGTLIDLEVTGNPDDLPF